jgi:hypothetical protein
MTGFLPGGKLRAMAALVAAYAIALQAVFTTLAPMQVRADGTVTVYCSGAGNTVAPDENSPATPATGKMSCVFCGACAGGFAVLPLVSGVAALLVERPLSLARDPGRNWLAAAHVRDGPARAPPPTV